MNILSWTDTEENLGESNVIMNKSTSGCPSREQREKKLNTLLVTLQHALQKSVQAQWKLAQSEIDLSFSWRTLSNKSISFRKFFEETTSLLQSMILVSKLMQFDSYLWRKRLTAKLRVILGQLYSQSLQLFHSH